MEFIRNLRDWHENFKKKVHSFRIPLGPTGAYYSTQDICFVLKININDYIHRARNNADYLYHATDLLGLSINAGGGCGIFSFLVSKILF